PRSFARHVDRRSLHSFPTRRSSALLVEQRVRVTRIANLGKDIALALAAPSVRIQAPVPGTSYIGIEVPNAQMGMVSLRPVMESEDRKSTRLNSSHVKISYAVFCLKK